MSRPLRFEFPGAVYYVTARGNAGQALFTDLEDGARFLDLLGREIAQQRWLCHAFCLLEDHYHLLIETPDPGLSRGMARLNMTYSQWFGRRHKRRGHLFEGRYRTKIVEKETWLLPLCRHIVLNPVRVEAVMRADLWRWSSYRPLAGGENPWAWLHKDWVHAQFDGDPEQGWSRYVEQGQDAPSPWRDLRSGHYLGNEPFLAKLAAMIGGKPLDQVPSAAADPLRPTQARIIRAVADACALRVSDLSDRKAHPDAFRAAAYLLRRAANIPLREVAALGDVSQGRISQIQKEIEDAGGLTRAIPWAASLEETFLRR